jgi:hypothetical protein
MIIRSAFWHCQGCRDCWSLKGWLFFKDSDLSDTTLYAETVVSLGCFWIPDDGVVVNTQVGQLGDVRSAALGAEAHWIRD